MIAALGLLAALCCGPALAEDAEPDAPAIEPTTRRKVVDWATPAGPWELSVAYRGSGWTLLHPGLATRVELPFALRDMRVENARRKLGFRHRTRTFQAGLDLGADVHVNNNTFVALQGVVGTRVTRTRGFTTGWSLSTGVQRAVLNHPSWRIKDDGSVGRVWLRGQWSHVMSVGYELGWDSQRRRETRLRLGRTERPALPAPVQWFVRPTLTLISPWMDVPLTPAVHVDIGVRAGLPAWRQVTGGAR